MRAVGWFAESVLVLSQVQLCAQRTVCKVCSVTCAHSVESGCAVSGLPDLMPIDGSSGCAV